MTSALAVAAGGDAADDLEQTHRSGSAADRTSLLRHLDLAVAWADNNPWVDTHDDGDIIVVLDGRLHNASSADDSAAKGLVARYLERGPDLARGLLGDFVIAVLDRRRHWLLVARDPVGVRPWYQATSGKRCAGASDIASLAKLPWVDTGVNESVAIEYLAAIPESRGETIHRGVRTLPPGHTWHRTIESVKTLVHHSWDIRPDLGISWDDAAQRCRDVIDEAVRCRLPRGASLASELSGGLDSSSVVGTLALLGVDDVVVGRLIFDGDGADERFYSDAVINHWRLPAVSVRPWTPPSEELWDLSRRLQRPSPDPNFTMFVSLHRALLGQHRSDGLTGLGGDDAFVSLGVAPRLVSAVKLRRARLLAEEASWAKRHPKRVWPDLLKPLLGYAVGPHRRGRHPAWVCREAAQQSERLWHSGRHARSITGIDAIDERLASFTSGYNAAILEERAAIGDWVGRRDSHPFLDPRFVQATYGLDPSWPSRAGHTRALQVAAFEDRLPAAVSQRRSKAQFSDVFWPYVLDPAALASVRTGPLRSSGWLDLTGFEALVENARRGMTNAAIPLFRCVSLDRWMRVRA